MGKEDYINRLYRVQQKKAFARIGHWGVALLIATLDTLSIIWSVLAITGVIAESPHAISGRCWRLLALLCYSGISAYRSCDREETQLLKHLEQFEGVDA